MSHWQEYGKAHYLANREKINQRRRQLYPERHKNKARERYLKNKEHRLFRAKERRQDPVIREHQNSMARDWKQAHRGYSTIHYRKNMGVTPKVVEELLNLQDGRCCICQHSFDQRKPFVDHDHQSGLIRGLLCSQCNSVLGFAKDQIPRLERAILYLKRAHRWALITQKP